MNRLQSNIEFWQASQICNSSRCFVNIKKRPFTYTENTALMVLASVACRYQIIQENFIRLGLESKKVKLLDHQEKTKF